MLYGGIEAITVIAKLEPKNPKEKSENSKTEQLKKPFAIAGLIYLVVSSVLLSYLLNYADNPDTFQYIVIAGKYLNLDWSNAINAYWSPLISWLLVVPLAVRIESVTAFKILQVAIGLFTLFQWCRLITRSPLSEWLKYILAISVIPFLLSYALLNGTPDLLFAGMVLWLLNVFLSGNVTTEPRVAFMAALAGAFMYYSKAFGLPLFIFISIGVILFERRKHKINPRAILLLYGTFILLCGVWIINISLRYGEFTISKTASFNNSLSQDMLDGKEELPVLGGGLIEPKNGNTSAWEAPGDYVNVKTTSHYTIDKYRRNILSIYYYDFRRQIGLIFILLLSMFIYRKGKELVNDKWFFVLITTIMLVYFGYSLILVHARYLWINTILMLLLSTVFIHQLINNRYFKSAVLAALFIIAVKRPLKEIFFIHDKDYPVSQLMHALTNPFVTLNETYGIDNEIQKSIAAFRKIRLPESNFASLKSAGFSRDGYATSLRITGSMDAVYFGEIKYGSDYLSQLTRSNVDYLITFENVSEMTPLFKQSDSGIRIYKAEKLD